MSLNDVTAEDLASTDTAVVGALGTGETTLRPAVGRSELVEEGVLLLQSEPWLSVLVGLHELSTVVPVVELVGNAIRVPALGEDQDVVTSTEGVGEDGDWAKVDVRVLTRGLAC